MNVTAEKISAAAGQYRKDAFILADELRDKALPILTEELFSEYEINGNRLHYENEYFGRRKFLSVFGFVSVVSHRPEDIKKLEQVMHEICEEECWALPAHVNRASDLNWRITIDLFASETGQTLTDLCMILGDELSDKIRAEVKTEVCRRILTPFLQSEKPFAKWERAKNNWNAVCCGNVGSIGLYYLEDEEERRKMIRRICYALEDFYLEGFGDDGACEEGLGYWVYGFTYYMLFALQLKNAYPEYDLTEGKKVHEIALFQQKSYFAGGRTISFSDGDNFSDFPLGLTCCLADLYDDVRFPDIEYVQKFGNDHCWRWIGKYWSWYWAEKYLDDVRSGKKKAPEGIEANGSEFLADVEWAIIRGAGNSAVAVKGGNNGVSHSHNDAGSFFYLVDGEAFLDDLGCGEYTKDYFSEKRYTIFCNKGEGHNIPLINGNDQKDGKEYFTDSFSMIDESTVEAEFESAYKEPGLDKLSRRVHLDRKTGVLTIEDLFAADAELVIQENFVTRLPVEICTDHILIKGIKHDVKMFIQGACGKPETFSVSHSNHAGINEEIHVLRWKSRNSKVTVVPEKK